MPIQVSYGQLAIFQSSLQQPFNAWTDRHVAQGFSWRPGSASFATLDHAGPIDVDVVRAAPNLARSPAVRIIALPFTVDETGKVEIASIADGEALSLTPGPYRLTFEHGPRDEGSMWCRLWFEPTEQTVSGVIVRADAALAPLCPLLMSAAPA